VNFERNWRIEMSSFKEIINRYEAGTSPEGERRMVESEVEKFEAISDYIYREPGPGDVLSDAGEGLPGTDFSGAIRKSTRRAFIKAGAVIFVLLLVILLFIQFGLSPIVSSFYYNPGEINKTNTAEQESETNLISLDLAVYSELSLPLMKQDFVQVINQGYGVYNIVISQSTYYNYDRYRIGDVAGAVTRGKLTLYNPNLLKGPVSNAFAFTDNATYAGNYSKSGHISDMKQFFKEDLASLGENEYAKVRISYTAPLSQTEIRALSEQYNFGSSMWNAVQVADAEDWGAIQRRGIQGYIDSFSGMLFPYDQDAYPNLTGQEDIEGDPVSQQTQEKMTEAHFLSMLKYMSDRSEFLALISGDDYDDSGVYSEAYDYVAGHGMKIYGSVVYADRETLQKLSEDEAVLYIEFDY
jgi:hypothetical protein